MRLSDAAGSVFELTVTGYQFPDSTWREKKYSWHMLEGAATFDGERWAFRYPALACDETPEVSVWLRSAADAIDAADRGDGQVKPLPAFHSFPEPVLAFRLVPTPEPGLAVVEFQLRLEFRRPSRRDMPSPIDADPIVLPGSAHELPFDSVRITSSAEGLRRAAAEWDAEWAPYPNGLAGVTASELRAEREKRRARGGDWMSG